MDIPISHIVPMNETGQPLIFSRNSSPPLIQAMKLFNAQRQAEQQYQQGQGVDEATAMAHMRARQG